MENNEAIHLLQQDLDDPGSVDIQALNKEQELGIEALKRIKKSRGDASRYYIGYLPGETEE